MVGISVLKFAEIGAFEGILRMSANLNKRVLFWTNNSRKSEERDLILSLISCPRKEVYLGVINEDFRPNCYERGLTVL